MARIWSHALYALFLLGVTACGGGGGGGDVVAPVNTPPVANFSFKCTDLVCTFTSTSTDSDAGGAIVAYGWSFGNVGAGSTSVVKDVPPVTYAAAGTYDVTLTVADNLGATATVLRKVTVTAPDAGSPRASFAVSCVAQDCTFTDTSTPGTGGSPLQSRTWDFGDATPAATTSPATHRYVSTTLTTYTVVLTVSDAAGKTSTSTQTLPLAPPASSINCVAGGVNCILKLTQASTVTATLVSKACQAASNKFVITNPIAETIFTDGCSVAVGTAKPINGGIRFAADTVLEVAVLSGVSDLVSAPSVRVSGSFDSGWTLAFDDGAGGPGEPDFNDLVILIKATP